MSKVGLGKSFSCAIKGLIWGISGDRNTLVHLSIGSLAIIASILLSIPRLDFIIILFTCFLVMTLELLNNSVERLTDFIFPSYNEKIGKVKDLMAGVVLVADIFAVVIGLLVLYKPLVIIMKINPLCPLFILFILNIIILPITLVLLIKKELKRVHSNISHGEKDDLSIQRGKF